MTEQESDALVAYLHSARLDWADRVTTTLLRVWYDVLGVFPVDMAKRALKSFHGQRAAGRQGFPPELGEVVAFLDAAWQAQTARERAAIAQEDREAAQRLLRGPVEAWGERGSLATVAVALVRDLCDGTLTPNSDEYVARQAEVERLAGPSRASCACEHGLVFYTIRRWNRPYAYVGRCACRLGDERPGYPVVSAETGRTERLSA